ncbi:MAG: fibronectin type III domain-containing protein, partial [Planctomycetaceae bacterium]
GKTVTGGRLDVYEFVRRGSFLDLDRPVYGPSQTVAILVSDGAANLDSATIETITVMVSSTTESTPMFLTLTETSASSAMFSGSVSLSSGPAVVDSRLQVSHGDVITATYAAGGYSDTAVVDALPPTIHGVSSAPSRLSSVVNWSTSEAATSRVLFGTSPDSLTRASSPTGPGLTQSVTVSGLTPSTLWYYRVEATDPSGNTGTSQVFSFTTTAPAPILFVDDDQNAQLEQHFERALQARNFSFDSWNVAAMGISPTAAVLGKYGRVIWNTGFEYSKPGSGLA